MRNFLKMTHLIHDVAKGPLDVYRKQATFYWKSMKLHFDGIESIRFQVKITFLMFNVLLLFNKLCIVQLILFFTKSQLQLFAIIGKFNKYYLALGDAVNVLWCIIV